MEKNMEHEMETSTFVEAKNTGPNESPGFDKVYGFSAWALGQI